ncbi:hypothetical protein BOX15_Mlig003251g1 [Macrostomum lignano]|uniref:Syntaxin 6/10/61 N-terminal domain-containing protein n=1 Tax=Macrostomum lignano TaxID=282301 RepID=A0A267F0S0_9PLAT|nr:hypothetical protein BOX15_Mlig003251g1 [Macrostomum lignano]
MDDPFLLDQNRIEGQIELLTPNFERWRQLRDGDLPPAGTEEREEVNEEYRYLTNELSTSVRSIGWEIDDLQETLSLMLKANSPALASASSRDNRSAFLVRVRSFIDEVAREVAMATTTPSNNEATEPDDEGIEDGDEEIDLESGKTRSRTDGNGAAGTAAAVPLMSWRKSSNSSNSSGSLTFPTVEIDSLRDLERMRFHNRDWAGWVYRYRYLLGMLAIVCLIVFITVVVLAAKHTAASTEAPTERPTCAPDWTHWWC